jgi:rubrerythrin
MALSFNADEVLETAERIERNGQHFYRKAAENMKDEKAKKLLLGLAEMEVEHEQIFAEMRKNLPKEAREPQVFDPDDELAQYLKALADSHIFNVQHDPADDLTGEETLEELLKTAVQLEKDSVLFYQGMRELVPPKYGREKVDQIVKEEMHHVNLLSNQLASLK